MGSFIINKFGAKFQLTSWWTLMRWWFLLDSFGSHCYDSNSMLAHLSLIWSHHPRFLWKCISLLGNSNGSFYSNFWAISVISWCDFALTSYLKSTKTPLNVLPNDSYCGFFLLFFVAFFMSSNQELALRGEEEESGSDGKTGMAGTPGTFKRPE